MIDHVLALLETLQEITAEKLEQLGFECWRCRHRAQNWVLQLRHTRTGENFTPLSVSCIDYLLTGEDKKALAQEIRASCDHFGYLLEPGCMILEGNPHPIFSTFSALHEAWIYALDTKNTEALHQLYRALLKLQGQEARSLEQWMTFLRSLGMTRLDEEKESITISGAVRQRYENCVQLEDGEIRPIETHPWIFEGKLAACGRLIRSEKEKPI